MVARNAGVRNCPESSHGWIIRYLRLQPHQPRACHSVRSGREGQGSKDQEPSVIRCWMKKEGDSLRTWRPRPRPRCTCPFTTCRTEPPLRAPSSTRPRPKRRRVGLLRLTYPGHCAWLWPPPCSPCGKTRTTSSASTWRPSRAPWACRPGPAITASFRARTSGLP